MTYTGYSLERVLVASEQNQETISEYEMAALTGPSLHHYLF